jgi:PhnB protein
MQAVPRQLVQIYAENSGWPHLIHEEMISCRERSMKVNTYLNYGGNCAEAFKFYEEHLGAKIETMMKFSEMPEPSKVPVAMQDAVLHARITIGDTAIMASDIPPDRFKPMRSAYLCLAVASDADAERIFALLSHDGEVFMPLQETFFASRFAQLRDRFGTLWMIIHERPVA